MAYFRIFTKQRNGLDRATIQIALGTLNHADKYNSGLVIGIN